MGKKRALTYVVLLLFLSTVVQAQDVKMDSISGNTENLNRQTDLLPTVTATDTQDVDHEKRMNKVWKQRAKYGNISYGLQTLKSNNTDLKSDMAFALTLGRTFYLHKKPIAGIMKFGVDWSYVDVNFAKYPDFPTAEGTTMAPDIELADLGIMQLEAGMSVGPSLTINPVTQLKLSLYFRVTPSYSLIIQDRELYQHYATFFNAGFTIAYKVLSIGLETRWNGATCYDNSIALKRPDKVYDDEGNFHDPFESYANKMKTNTLRLFIGFRF